MTIEIKVPVLPESVADATVASWHKKVGDAVKRDENLVDIETDKVVLEVVAPEDGFMAEILHQEGDTVTANQLLAKLEAQAPAAVAPVADKVEPESPPKAKAEVVAKVKPDLSSDKSSITREDPPEIDASPSVRRALVENGMNSRDFKKNTVSEFLSSEQVARSADISEKRVPMTRLRQKIAERLLSAQQSAAILTTFNEVDLSKVIALRNEYKDKFQKIHGVKLGFMSFFVMATVAALKKFPAVNASIDGNDIVYHNYFNIGIAVSSPRGLVVPVISSADKLSMAEVELSIKNFGEKARDGKLDLNDLQGGTFTISNGGVFGSMLSTPILNPPQSGILGMHKTIERPVVENGNIVIKPMMYLALSYDHRIIDGSESVRFLVAIKEALEEPSKLLLQI